MPANAFKTLFLLLTLLATCTQCLLNEKKVSSYTPSNLGLRTSGISESAILIFGWVLSLSGQIDGEAGWWTTSGNIVLPPLARVKEVGR